jgi:transposase, IS5 family
MDYFELRLPCDATLIGKFRKLIGEQGVEELLSQTVSAALSMKVISKKALATVVVDSTVQPKAIAHPTDSRLLEVARQKLVEVAKDTGISLKQTFAKESKQLTRKAGGYTHARQFRRMRKPINRQRTIVGKLVGSIERQVAALADDMKQTIQESLRKAQRLITQTKYHKTKGIPKLYSWHAPEVEVIAKGKARTPYEFDVKVGITTTLKGNLIVGARSFPNNLYDGYTLAEQLEQASILANSTIKDVYVDSYRGVDQQNPSVSITHRGKYKRLNDKERKLLKRRQAIEPIIGHLKAEHHMNPRCYLKGAEGDAIYTVMCAASYNVRWLLRMIRKKGIRLYLAQIKLLGLGGLFAKYMSPKHVELFECGQLRASLA